MSSGPGSALRAAFWLVLAPALASAQEAADPQVGELDAPAAAAPAAAEKSPLDDIVGDGSRLGSAAEQEQAVLRLARSVRRSDVKDLIAKRADSADLVTALDAGRNGVVRQVLERAMKIGNADLASRKLAPLARLLSVNSGSGDDFTRDADITIFGGDGVREAALFRGIEQAAAEMGLKVRVTAGGITFDQLEVTLFPSRNDLPDARYAETPEKHERMYRDVTQKQRAEKETYKGGGWKREVYMRRDPATARVHEITWSPGQGAAVSQGYLPQNGEEVQRIFRGSATRRLEKWEIASSLVSPAIQARLHGADPDGDPTKGPVKYAARSIDDVCAYFDFPPWKSLSPDDRAEVVSRVADYLDPKVPAQRRLLDAYVAHLDSAVAIRDATKAGKASPVSPDEAKRLGVVCANFLSRAVAKTASEMAAAMLEPPPFRPVRDGFTEEELGRVAKMRPRELHEFLRKKDADYRRCVSAEAMEDLLMTVVEIRMLDVRDGRKDRNTAQSDARRTGAAVLQGITANAPGHLKPLLQLADRYAGAYAASSGAADPEACAAAMRELYAIRAEMRKAMGTAQTRGEEVIAHAGRTAPASYLQPDAAKRAPVLLGAGSRIEQRLRDRMERRAPGAGELRRRIETSPGPSAAGSPVPGIRQRIAHEAFQLGSVVDVLAFVEMQQRGASWTECGQFLGETVLGRCHWAAGFFISGAKARTDEDMARLRHDVAFFSAAQFLPGLGSAKVAFDVARGTLDVTVGYTIAGEHADTIDAAYVGENRLGPVDRKTIREGTVASASRATGANLLADRHFLVVQVPGEPVAQRVVDTAAVYRDWFRTWTGAEWDAFDAGDRRTGGARDELTRAHDELVRCLRAEAGASGPLWFPAPGRSVTDWIQEAAGWMPPPDSEIRAATESFVPLLEERCRRSVREFVEANALPTYRTFRDAEGHDIVEDGLTRRLAADVFTGMTNAWRQRATDQLLARREIERRASYEDLSELADQVCRTAFEHETPAELPAAAVQVGILGSERRPLPGSKTPLFDGALPIVFGPVVLPASATKPSRTLKLAPVAETVSVVARADRRKDDGTAGPGDVIRTETTFALTDDAGAEVARTTVEYDVLLPADEGKLPIRRHVGDLDGDRVDFTYVDLAPLQPEGWRPSAGKAPPVVPKDWILSKDGCVFHGTFTATTAGGTVTTKEYALGRLHGRQTVRRPDGRPMLDRPWEHGLVHGRETTTRYESGEPGARPIRTVERVYERGILRSAEVRDAGGTVREKATLELENADEVKASGQPGRARYRGRYEVFREGGKQAAAGGFADLADAEFRALPTPDATPLYGASLEDAVPSANGARVHDGPCTIWWPGGAVQEQSVWVRGRAEGSYLLTWNDGTPRRRGAFAGGFRGGTWTYFYKSGRREIEGTFGGDGEPVGTWIQWADDDRAKPSPTQADENLSRWLGN